MLCFPKVKRISPDVPRGPRARQSTDVEAARGHNRSIWKTRAEALVPKFHEDEQNGKEIVFADEAGFSEWEWTSEKGAREGDRLRSRCCAWGQHVPFLNARNHPQACVWEGASGQSILPVSVDTGRCARRLLPRATCPTLTIVNITEAGGTYLHVFYLYQRAENDAQLQSTMHTAARRIGFFC